MGMLLIVDEAGSVLYRGSRLDVAERVARQYAAAGQTVYLMEARSVYYAR